MDDLDRRLRLTNLNLLPTLHAVLKHRNLTRAAEELNLTQSAVSNSLKRLREHFADDLLVRDGRSLRMTDKAKRLVDPLEKALSAMGEVLADAPFDPAVSGQKFRIATADYVTAITAPAMAGILAREAPGISVQMVTARGRSVGHLRVDTIDMVISPRQVVEAAIFDAPSVLRDVVLEPLASEPFVCLGRADDADLARGLTAEAYFARPHASFVLDMEVHASIEHAWLMENGAEQFDRIQTSDFNILPMIAAGSDCLVLVPRSLAHIAVAAMPLRMVPAPIPVPDLELVMIWNRRRESDPELTWLRDLIRRCAVVAINN